MYHDKWFHIYPYKLIASLITLYSRITGWKICVNALMTNEERLHFITAFLIQSEA